MSFSVTIPADTVNAANETLRAAGWGEGNFSIPLKDSEGASAATHVALHHFAKDPAFRAACAALPGAVVKDAPDLTVAFEDHIADLGLERL